jgi:tripartite-type tricarboxylate transporter receptor subunit TctC
MRSDRRRCLALAAGAIALPALTRLAAAQDYPARPVRMMVGFVAGGAADLTARVIGQWLSERLGQPFVIENRPGAGTTLAAETVAKAAPDGHTLAMILSATAISSSVYDRPGFNLVRDIAPVAGVNRTPVIVDVHPSVPVHTIPELIAYAKANPGKLSMASAGNGSTQHLSGELFKMMTGVDMVHVPYRGTAAAMPDLLVGRVQVMFDVMASSIEHVRRGALRALGVATLERLEALPDLPTVAETLPGYEATAWNGIGAPQGTPAAIIEKLNREINAALADPKIKASFAELGAIARPDTTAAFGRFMVEETEKWAKVAKFSGVKPE